MNNNINTNTTFTPSAFENKTLEKTWSLQDALAPVLLANAPAQLKVLWRIATVVVIVGIEELQLQQIGDHIENL